MAVLVAGYTPADGFRHTGKPRSFVWGIVDLWKLQARDGSSAHRRPHAEGQVALPLEQAVRLTCLHALELGH